MMRRRGGLVRTVGRTAVVAGTASAVGGAVGRRQQNNWQEEQQEAAAAQQVAYDQGVADATAPPPPPAPAADAPGEDLVSQLEGLAKLRDQGVLTDAEFEQQKAKILGS
ncbi:MAG: SHOCT domain-containing protein [Acidimicrobiales bacterium]